MVVRAQSNAAGVRMGFFELLRHMRGREAHEHQPQYPMATNTFSRLFRPSAASVDVTDYICQSCRRQQSSYRRTRKALSVKPDASFLPSKTEPRDHIIFNPPSSIPNVYHTPQKFLPQNDPRRRLHSLAPTASATPPSTPATSASSNLLPQTHQKTQPLPEPVRPIYEKKYHLSPEQCSEIRKLRAENPRQWTRVRLAEKYECSQFFVGLICSGVAPEVQEQYQKQLEAVKSKWGPRKREAREMRVERKKIWGRDA